MNNYLVSFLVGCALSAFATAGSSNGVGLLADEKNNIEIFQKFAPKVVYVHRLALTRHLRLNERRLTGAGSGIIWDNKGHIVTNFHVIKGADDLAISMDKLTFPVKVIGVEPRKDLAVLAITSPYALKSLKSFVPFKMAHNHTLLVGQKAIAIGNPFGLDHTLTIGIISALKRQVPGIGGVTIHEMIQTDASINPGNSGGPLLDSQGRLIGVNTAIYSNTGSSAGIGFAIPADDLERIVPQIIKNGRATLAGIGIQPVESHIAARLGIKKGILIDYLLPHTPAAYASLHETHRDGRGRVRLGDVIVAMNHQPIENYDSLYNFLSTVKIGDYVDVTIKRQNQTKTIGMKTVDVAGF